MNLPPCGCVENQPGKWEKDMRLGSQSEITERRKEGGGKEREGMERRREEGGGGKADQNRESEKGQTTQNLPESSLAASPTRLTCRTFSCLSP